MVGSENTTKQTDASVEAFLAAIDDPNKRADSQRLSAILREITGEPPTLWGRSIIGFGSYHYVYESGREGDMPLVGFSPRKSALTLYLAGEWDQQQEALKRLGLHKLGKGCLYLKRLADVDEAALRELIQRTVTRFS